MKIFYGSLTIPQKEKKNCTKREKAFLSLEHIEAAIQTLSTTSPTVAITIIILLEVATSDEICGEEDEEHDDLKDGNRVPHVPNVFCDSSSAQAAV